MSASLAHAGAPSDALRTSNCTTGAISGADPPDRVVYSSSFAARIVRCLLT